MIQHSCSHGYRLSPPIKWFLYCVMDGLICSSKLYLFIVDDMKEAHKSFCTNMTFENE